MKREDIAALYDPDYADEYDERFLLADHTAANTRHELALLRELLPKGASWLDIGCGTGYFLAQFPGVPRAGLDLSPSMLELARQRNPDALCFRQADFREPVPEWGRRWTVVSCMWAAYAYVDTVAQVGGVVRNMVDWTADGGSVLIPIIDLPDLRPVDVTYKEATYFSGEVWVNGVIWSWTDARSGRVHSNLIAPHLEQFIEWLAPHFEEIRVVSYPTIFEGVAERKALLATGRRGTSDPGAPAKVVRPEPPPDAASPAPPDLESVRVGALAAELLSRIRLRRMWRGLRARLRRIS
jgi:SAM-dependent methyltransferase